MALHRFYCDSIDGPAVELEWTEAHHLAVLRLVAGDKVELFDGLGGLATAVISGIRKNKVALRVEDVQRNEPARSRRIIIAVSIPKGERFDWLIEKCTELGIDRICPVIFERTVKQPANPKTISRWLNLAVSASKQCKRLFLPKIDAPMSLQEVLKSIKNDHSYCRFLFGSPSPDSPALITIPFGPTDVIAFIGPEGGLTDDEAYLLKENGARPVQLTDTILRVETAAMAFAAVLCAQRDAVNKVD
jgi:16S rRNA (uracil1498-N3)-methyltransferase